TSGDHRSPNRWIAKIIAAIPDARSSGGTARRPTADTGDVDRNSPISARNASAKNSIGVGIPNAIAVSGAAITMPHAQTLSDSLIASLFARSFHAVVSVTGGPFAIARSAHRPPTIVPIAPPTTVTPPKMIEALEFASCAA